MSGEMYNELWRLKMEMEQSTPEQREIAELRSSLAAERERADRAEQRAERAERALREGQEFAEGIADEWRNAGCAADIRKAGILAAEEIAAHLNAALTASDREPASKDGKGNA